MSLDSGVTIERFDIFMEFDRWLSEDSYTHAYRLFNKHHTLMNSIYWSYAPVFAYTQSLYSTEKGNGVERSTHQMFNLKGLDSDRVPHRLGDWSKSLKEFDNWTRLNALVSLSAYFEIYLSSVVSLAIESDLGLLYSVPRLIDGVKIIKYGNEENYSFFDKSQGITKGEWSKRRSNFVALFGSAPDELTKHEGTLENIRKIRNNMAHAFGRDIDISRSRKTISILEMDRVSIKRLQEYMGIIREVARAVDNQLLRNHIGQFETLYFYHQVKNGLNNSNKLKDFKKKLNSLLVKNKSIKYCKDLIEFYDNL